MNDSLFNATEKRIIQGCIPNIQLKSITYTGESGLLKSESYTEGYKLLFDKRDLTVRVLKLIAIFEASDYAGQKEWLNNFFQRFVKVMINTGFWPNDVTEEVYQDAVSLCPGISQIDKILKDAIVLLYSKLFSEGIKRVGTEDELKEQKNIIVALLQILNMVQYYEYKTHCTIDIEKLDFESHPMIILTDWGQKVVELLNQELPLEERVKDYFNWVRQSEYIIPLSDKEVESIKQLFEKRSEIDKKIQVSNRQIAIVAEETNQDWELFLQFIYDLSGKEERVIQRINDKHSTATEKLQIIEEYENEVELLRKGSVFINNQAEDFNRITCSVEKRLEYSQLREVKDEDGEEFGLDPNLLFIIKRYEDYNYFLIKYHHFRLTSDKVTKVKEFLRLSLSIITRNLLQEEPPIQDSSISIMELVSSFYIIVTDFYNSNKHILDKLPYSELQEPSTNAEIDTLNDMSFFSFFLENIDIVEKMTKKLIDQADEMQAIEDEIESLTDDEILQYLFTDITHAFKKIFLEEDANSEERFLKINDEIKARQIVVSLDIIYLFCDAVRIILQNPDEYGIKEEIQNIKQMYEHLLRVEKKINVMVYSDIPEDKPDLSYVRRERGVDSKSLSEQEYHEEQLRNNAFKRSYDGVIKVLLDQIEKGNIIEVFNSKSLVQEELSRVPNCGYKELYTELFESFSYELCKRLVAKDQRESESFLIRKKNVCQQLGIESKMLPMSTIDSLTTAELLFGKYVTPEYAEKGFDYSCISALYYQAFEEAYNTLIWQGYAEKLNTLELLGRDFTKILFIKNRSDDLTIAIEPYFFTQANKYLSFKDKITKKLSNSCMYSSFVTLMKELTVNSELTEFRQYFAEKVGFGNSAEMERDKDFMKMLSTFISSIECCIVNRNNASHGGVRVEAEQCKIDKKHVISNMESVRKESFGLVQQLLFLLNYMTQADNKG